MEFLALVAQTSICGEIAGDVSKCRLFSQEEVKTNRKQKNPKRASGTGCAASSETQGQSGYDGAFQPLYVYFAYLS